MFPTNDNAIPVNVAIKTLGNLKFHIMYFSALSCRRSWNIFKGLTYTVPKDKLKTNTITKTKGREYLPNV
jgi:hypothetical protein